MALTSVFYDGYVTETDRAQNLAGAAQYGVYGPDDFKVTAHPSIPFAVLVKAGRAHGHGVTDTAAEDQVVQCAAISAPASNYRWDLIVVRRNWQPAAGGPSTLEAVQAGATAAIPAGRKVGPGVEDDQPLYLIKWQGGTSAPVEFIDLRVHAANNGLFAKSELAMTYLTGVGTAVNINGVNWSLQLGLNGLATPVKAPDIAYTSLTPPDAGWSVAGGLSRVRMDSGRAMVTCAARVTRMPSPPGGQFPVGPGFASLLGGFIPDGWRPSIVTDCKAVLNDSFGNGVAEPVARVGTDGTVALRPQVGGANLSGDTGWFISLNMHWYQ